MVRKRSRRTGMPWPARSGEKEWVPPSSHGLGRPQRAKKNACPKTCLIRDPRGSDRAHLFFLTFPLIFFIFSFFHFLISCQVLIYLFISGGLSDPHLFHFFIFLIFLGPSRVLIYLFISGWPFWRSSFSFFSFFHFSGPSKMLIYLF